MEGKEGRETPKEYIDNQLRIREKEDQLKKKIVFIGENGRRTHDHEKAGFPKPIDMGEVKLEAIRKARIKERIGVATPEEIETAALMEETLEKAGTYEPVDEDLEEESKED